MPIAPQTSGYYHKLASHCCVCGLPLVDATSIEKGIGPICRKKYNYEDAPDLVDRIPKLLELLPKILPELELKLTGPIQQNQSRKAANILVAFASAEMGDYAAKAAYLLKQMGYTALGERIMNRLIEIRVTEEGEKYLVACPFSVPFLKQRRALRDQGATFDFGRKLNVFPKTLKNELWAALKAAYPNQLVLTPKGLFELK